MATRSPFSLGFSALLRFQQPGTLLCLSLATGSQSEWSKLAGFWGKGEKWGFKQIGILNGWRQTQSTECARKRGK